MAIYLSRLHNIILINYIIIGKPHSISNWFVLVIDAWNGWKWKITWLYMILQKNCGVWYQKKYYLVKKKYSKNLSAFLSLSVSLPLSLSIIPKCSLSGVYGIFWMSGDTMIGTDSPVNGWIASMDSKISGIQKRTWLHHSWVSYGYGFYCIINTLNILWLIV